MIIQFDLLQTKEEKCSFSSKIVKVLEKFAHELEKYDEKS